MLLDLEKEVITFAAQLGFLFTPQVSVQQLRAIEVNPYAFELAQVSVQIGYLQWRRDNGFDNDRSPVLQDLEGSLNEDALLVPHYRNKAKTLTEAQAAEHAEDRALKFYTERTWPACEVIVSHPPFLGDKRMRGQLGDGYVEELRRIYGDRLPGQSELCCYWFEKARELIERGQVDCGRPSSPLVGAVSAVRAALRASSQHAPSGPGEEPAREAPKELVALGRPSEGNAVCGPRTPPGQVAGG